MDTRETLGSIGEDLVAEHLGPAAILTREFDKYHDHDILFFDKTVQVKAFQLNRKTQSFWLGENYSKTMWNKIDSTDQLYFVQVPHNKTDLINIYRCPNHASSYVMEKRNDGTPVRSYPLTSCELVDTIDNQKLSEDMYNLSCSMSKFRK